MITAFEIYLLGLVDNIIDLCALVSFLSLLSIVFWTTTEFIKHNLDLVPVKFRKLMIDEIEMAERKEFGYSLGDDCDAKNWLDLREFLKEHLND